MLGDLGMNVYFRIVAVVLNLCVGSVWLFAAQPADLGDLKVKSVSVTEVDANHVKVAVDLTLVPAQTVTLNDLRLCSLRLNGLPVFAAPVEQEIALHKGSELAMPPLYVTVLFRDISTVEPLRRILADQNVHIQGELEAGIRLNFAEKLALHTQHPTVHFAISQDVPADVGGSPLQRTLELAMLSAIDSGLAAKAQAEKMIPGAQPDWVRALDAQAALNVFDVQSSYSLASKDGKESSVVSDQLGFRVGAGAVVTTAEAREPWKYDVEVLDALKGGSAKMVKQSLEMQLIPMGLGGVPLKLGAKEFVAEARGNPEEHAAITDNKNQIQVFRRASPSSLTLLMLPTPAVPSGVQSGPAGAPQAQAGLVVATAAVAEKESWERVAVLRHHEDTATHLHTVEILQLSAHREGNGIQLSDPVDSAVFGSPIVTPDGVIGMVQDEQTGTFLPAEMLPAAALPGPSSATATSDAR
jgi:hypothetical protein